MSVRSSAFAHILYAFSGRSMQSYGMRHDDPLQVGKASISLHGLRLFAPNCERSSQISPKLIAEWYRHSQTGAQIRKQARQFLTCQKISCD